MSKIDIDPKDLPVCYLAIAHFPQRENPISIGLNGSIEDVPGMYCMAMMQNPEIRNAIVASVVLYCKESNIDLATIYENLPA